MPTSKLPKWNGPKPVLISLVTFNPSSPSIFLTSLFFPSVIDTFNQEFAPSPSLSTTIFVGLYLIIKRKQPNYFNNKLLGLYLLLIVVVVWCHLDYFKDINNIHFTETLKGSWDDIYAFVENPAYNLNSGGILGAILGFTFIKLYILRKNLIWTSFLPVHITEHNL